MGKFKPTRRLAFTLPVPMSTKRYNQLRLEASRAGVTTEDLALQMIEHCLEELREPGPRGPTEQTKETE